jgi:5-hydroxyisourate hydrolase
MGKLTTHVLDTTLGRPAADLWVELYRLEEQRTMLMAVKTNADGRCDAPLLEGEALEPGRYELVFQAAEYLRRHHSGLSEPPFLDEIPIRFGIASQHESYHVPLLLSPFGYSTYRGS